VLPSGVVPLISWSAHHSDAPGQRFVSHHKRAAMGAVAPIRLEPRRWVS
jgi:hypothetical protein